MGLLRRIFGNGKEREGSAGQPASSLFQESETATSEPGESRNAPRRELVQVMLRDTMRKHGIPSDWIECRILSTVTRSGRPCLHVNFVVLQAHEQMLRYVFAFQDSFETELARFDPRAGDWLMSLGWEFQGHDLTAAMPEPAAWTQPAQPPAAGSGSRTPLVDGKRRAFAPTADEPAADLPRADDDIQRDLATLFAIRDAAMADAAHKPGDADRPEFEPTRPFDDTRPQKKSR